MPGILSEDSVMSLACPSVIAKERCLSPFASRHLMAARKAGPGTSWPSLHSGPKQSSAIHFRQWKTLSDSEEEAGMV